MRLEEYDGHCPVCGCWLEEMPHAETCPNKTWIATIGTDYQQLIVDEDRLDKVYSPAPDYDKAAELVEELIGNQDVYPNSPQVLRLVEFEAPDNA